MTDVVPKFDLVSIKIRGEFAFARVQYFVESPLTHFGHLKVTFDLPIPLPEKESLANLRDRAINLARQSLKTGALLDLVRSGQLPEFPV